MKLPELEAWAIFAKVVETGSFARAAAALSLSQATVSKAIARLEARSQVTLLHRTSRRMTITESGQAALEHANRILEEGQALEAELTEQSVSLRGLIRVSAPMSFGVAHVAPALPAFMRRHPQVQLDISLNDDLVDLVANRFDLAVRLSNLADSSLLARRLCTVRVLLVAAPGYFERQGYPKHPRELVNHHALLYTLASCVANWRFKHAHHGEFVQPMSSTLWANNAEALKPALYAGLGLALQPEFLVCQDIQAGTLVTAMQDWQVEPIALHIVTPPGRRRPARVQALIEYLADCFLQKNWALSA